MKRQKRTISIIAICLFSVALVFAIAFGLLVVFIYKDIDFQVDERLFDSSRSFESTLFYAEGEVIETSGSIRKLHYSLDEISPYVSRGFIAVEDRVFYEHSGVDIKRTALAAINLVVKKDDTFGASTITQQVIKNISGDNQVKIRRKICEILRALHIERIYTKNDILEVYLNVIPMGDNIYGIGAASRAYFGKEPSDLSVEEAATLIGITNAPTAYSPYLNPDACLRKRNIVLGVMRSQGVITDSEYDEASSKPLTVIAREDREDRFNSWFVETAIQEICEDMSHLYGITESAARLMLLGGGYKVYTTMDRSVQNTLEEYFEDYDNLADETSNGLNYAMVITDSKSGNLLGIIGRAGEKRGNRLLSHATIPHIPASTLKPIALYAPLIDQEMINWATVFDDVPVKFLENNREYPKNSPDVYDGLTTVKDAIRLSKNTVAVRLSEMLTPKGIYNSLIDNFGFDTLVERDGNITDIDTAPMALGQLCVGIPLTKMVSAYGSFASDGVYHERRSYISIYDHNDRLVMENKPKEKRVFKESTARIMNQLLMNVTESGTASSITLKNKVDTAGKTGTSSGNKDKLFIGYTPSYVAGLWCGYDNGLEIHSMSKSHLKIWDEVMLEIYENINERESFSTEGLEYLPYCMDSGREYSEKCIYDPRGSRLEYGYFSSENTPRGKCDRHVIMIYDSLTKAVASHGCPGEDLVPISLIYIPDRAFPKEIIITDAEYVCRDIMRYDTRPIDYALPYFEYTIPDGVYVGRSKNKKQFNSGCYLHDD